jgi:large subunit ribosomal protein L4
MIQCDVLTLENKLSGKVDLSESIFGVEVRTDILHRMVKWQLAKRQSGNHKVKERGEVRGSTAKIYRQKGTGRARHGSKKVSQFVGGGVTFGPVVRTHAFSLPKKVRRLALRCALSSKQSEGKLVILDSAQLQEPKTKTLSDKVKAFGWSSVLIVDSADLDENLQLAAGNLGSVDVISSEGANVYDILKRDFLVLTTAAVSDLEGRLK